MNVQKFWQEQGPNVVFYILSTIVVGAGTGITSVTHGLKWWQQAILVALYLIVIACAAIAIFIVHKRHRVPESSAPKEVPTVTQQDSSATGLSQRIDALAKGLFGFLKSLGEESPPSISYIVRVHSGYMRAWYHKVEDVAYELGIFGYVDFKFAKLTGNELEAFSYSRIREIAEYLLKIKNEMELNGLRNSTLSQKDVEKMSSDELKRRWDEPGFQSDVNMLGVFKQQ